MSPSALTWRREEASSRSASLPLAPVRKGRETSRQLAKGKRRQSGGRSQTRTKPSDARNVNKKISVLTSMSLGERGKQKKKKVLSLRTGATQSRSEAKCSMSGRVRRPRTHGPLRHCLLCPRHEGAGQRAPRLGDASFLPTRAPQGRRVFPRDEAAPSGWSRGAGIESGVLGPAISGPAEHLSVRRRF